MPGHTFPLRAAEGGTLTRAGQTEAAVDLATLAGLYPAGVITELMKPDGTMARMPDLEEFAEQHDIKILTVEQLIAYRRRNEKLVAKRVEAAIPIGNPDFERIKNLLVTPMIFDGRNLYQPERIRAAGFGE